MHFPVTGPTKQSSQFSPTRCDGVSSGYVVDAGGWAVCRKLEGRGRVWPRGLLMIISARTCCTWKSSYDSLFLLGLLARRSDGPA